MTAGTEGGKGPLHDVRVLELGSLGPGPFGCMLLADMGADVIRVDRPGAAHPAGDVLLRGRRSVVIDLKSDDGKVFLAELIASCDVLCEGFRPGVLERLGFDPERCLQLNPRLVIARVTGWGQNGPLADTVGHDINYAGVAGVIHAIGPTGGDPVIPLNLVADGGGGWMLAFGVMCGLWESRGSGRGQVIDVAMLDASALMMAKWFGEYAAGSWRDERGMNRIDGGSHFYHIYRTADGRHLSVGAIETKFYETFMSLLGFDVATLPDQHDRGAWPEMTGRVAALIAEQPLQHWVETFEGHEVCVTPVSSLSEATQGNHARARQTFVEVDGIVQPGAAPRFDRTPGSVGRIPELGEHTAEVRAEFTR
ncbi:MAG: CoA transferase [Actinobacteria bacterium]|nr:CoA transferase [Actinomycetota bacterium]